MRALLVVGLLLASGPVGSQAEDETRQIQATISAQWQAFAADDGAKALSYAIAPIRDSFPEPEGFLQMVQNGYPMVYRHQATRFLPPRIVEDLCLQVVRMTDEDSDVWLVLYQLRKQADGRWLIGGVSAFPAADVPDLVPSPDQS